MRKTIVKKIEGTKRNQPRLIISLFVMFWSIKQLRYALIKKTQSLVTGIVLSVTSIS